MARWIILFLKRRLKSVSTSTSPLRAPTARKRSFLLSVWWRSTASTRALRMSWLAVTRICTSRRQRETTRGKRMNRAKFCRLSWWSKQNNAPSWIAWLLAKSDVGLWFATDEKQGHLCFFLNWRSCLSVSVEGCFVSYCRRLFCVCDPVFCVVLIPV